MHKRLPPEAEQMKSMIPEFQVSKAELIFSGSQSLFHNLPDEEDQMPQAGDGGGRRFNMRFGGGVNDESFRDYDKELITEKRELGPKTYLIDDTLHPLKWKLEEDTMTLNGHLCYKATTTTSMFGFGGGRRPGGDSARNNNQQQSRTDSAMRRYNIPQEQKVVAWFAQDIECPAGPDAYFGLPGLILKLVVDEGTITYTTLSIDPIGKAVVKAPTSGKKITREEYRSMMQQQFQGMRPPGGGGQRMMIINQ